MRPRYVKRTVLGMVVLAAMLAGSIARATGNIDPANNFAWSENAGWINFAPANGGVTVSRAGLSGYAWAENIGWIKLAALGSTYGNTTTNDWGVKLVGKTLQGFAWSENAGWINFAPTQGGGVTISNGWFNGYAWSENVGWVQFQNASPAYGVRTTASLWAATAVLFQ